MDYTLVMFVVIATAESDCCCYCCYSWWNRWWRYVYHVVFLNHSPAF